MRISETTMSLLLALAFPGLYMLYQMRELGLSAHSHRGGRRRRRDLVLESLSRRALRYRYDRVLLQLR